MKKFKKTCNFLKELIDWILRIIAFLVLFGYNVTIKLNGFNITLADLILPTIGFFLVWFIQWGIKISSKKMIEDKLSIYYKDIQNKLNESSIQIDKKLNESSLEIENKLNEAKLNILIINDICKIRFKNVFKNQLDGSAKEIKEIFYGNLQLEYKEAKRYCYDKYSKITPEKINEILLMFYADYEFNPDN